MKIPALHAEGNPPVRGLPSFIFQASAASFQFYSK